MLIAHIFRYEHEHVGNQHRLTSPRMLCKVGPTTYRIKLHLYTIVQINELANCKPSKVKNNQSLTAYRKFSCNESLPIIILIPFFFLSLCYWTFGNFACVDLLDCIKSVGENAVSQCNYAALIFCIALFMHAFGQRTNKNVIVLINSLIIQMCMKTCLNTHKKTQIQHLIDVIDQVNMSNQFCMRYWNSDAKEDRKFHWAPHIT